MNEKYAIFFKEHRIRSGYKSQRQLSDRSGVSQTTISRLERGDQKPSIETLKELAIYLTSTTYGEMLLACGYWDDDISKELHELTEDNKTKKFINELDLTNEEFEYDIKIDGESLSKEDVQIIINLIREKRSKKSLN